MAGCVVYAQPHPPIDRQGDNKAVIDGEAWYTRLDSDTRTQMQCTYHNNERVMILQILK